MIPLIDTSALQARLEEIAIDIPGVIVIDSSQRDIKQTWGKNFNIVYILRQVLGSTTPGGTSGRVKRQTYNAAIEICVVTRKYVDGSLDERVTKKQLSDAVYQKVFCWTCPGCDLAFDLNAYTDGDPADTVDYAVHRYHTQIIVQGTIP